jgi:hypothetical protein
MLDLLYEKVREGDMFEKYKNVRENSWREHYKKFVTRMVTMVKGPDSLVPIIKEKKVMSNEDRNRRDFGVCSSLKAGKSLREIGARVGVAPGHVYRIGAKRGVFSVRSVRSTTRGRRA